MILQITALPWPSSVVTVKSADWREGNGAVFPAMAEWIHGIGVFGTAAATTYPRCKFQGRLAAKPHHEMTTHPKPSGASHRQGELPRRRVLSLQELPR